MLSGKDGTTAAEAGLIVTNVVAASPDDAQGTDGGAPPTPPDTC